MWSSSDHSNSESKRPGIDSSGYPRGEGVLGQQGQSVSEDIVGLFQRKVAGKEVS